MRFYGQFDPPVDKVLYDTYFTDVRGGVCIEAGVAGPVGAGVVEVRAHVTALSPGGCEIVTLRSFLVTS